MANPRDPHDRHDGRRDPDDPDNSRDPDGMRGDGHDKRHDPRALHDGHRDPGDPDNSRDPDDIRGDGHDKRHDPHIAHDPHAIPAARASQPVQRGEPAGHTPQPAHDIRPDQPRDQPGPHGQNRAHAWRQLAACARTQARPALRAAQTGWLLDCVRRNARCAYGRLHGFEKIASLDDFRQRVPPRSYDDYRPWIARIAQGEADLLFDGLPLAFEVTSGSSGAGKLIPYGAASLADFSRALAPWIGGAARRYGFSGRAYWAISPVARAARRTPGGAPVGLPDAAYLGAHLAPAFAALSAVPPSVAAADGIDAWQRQTWLGLLRCADLELISVWSPTFLLALLDALPLHADALAAQLDTRLRARGGKGGSARDMRNARDDTRADDARADDARDRAALRRLRAYLDSGSGQALWPRLRLVSCWRDGASRAFSDALNARLPHADFEAKGLLMTEGVVTVPDAQGAPVLAAQSGFYEFLDDAGQLRLADELEPGQCYEVVMTTAGGLYRYRTADQVRYRGNSGDNSRGNGEGWPILDFLGRAGLCSDLVGEKLTEAFVADCLCANAQSGNAGMTPGNRGFQMLVAQLEPAPHYALIVDLDDNPAFAASDAARGAQSAAQQTMQQIAQRIEQRLLRNPQYRYARALGQLQPLRIVPVRQPLAAYVRRMLARGMRVGDVKPVALRPETDWMETFSGHGR